MTDNTEGIIMGMSALAGLATNEEVSGAIREAITTAQNIEFDLMPKATPEMLAMVRAGKKFDAYAWYKKEHKCSIVTSRRMVDEAIVQAIREEED